jgi:tRNA(Ile)-lysidine synthase
VLVAAARRAIEAQDLLEPRDCVLVACSGGPDSTALLLVLHELAPVIDLELCVVHVDHGLRPGSGAEASHVGALAGRIGRSFRATRVEVRPGPGGLQERARAARYERLEAVATELGCARIAVGHTRTDQAETVLHRVLRGAGLAGLGAIPWRRGRVVRPLLGVGRRQVLAFLAERGESFLEDPSNERPDFLRVRLRKEALPLLESLVPGVEERLSALAGDARAAHDALVILTAPWARPSVEAVLAAPAEARAVVLRRVLGDLRGDLRGLGRAHFEAALGLVTTGPLRGEVHLPGGALVRRGDVLSWELGRGKQGARPGSVRGDGDDGRGSQ